MRLSSCISHSQQIMNDSKRKLDKMLAEWQPNDFHEWKPSEIDLVIVRRRLVGRLPRRKLM